jgi:predicted Zn-dependent protease
VIQPVRFYAYIIALYLLLIPGGATANQINTFHRDIPADYIIAGNLDHELGQRWLKARSLSGQGELEQSRIQYILLLHSYPDLLQARYEYVEVLQSLERFKEAEVELELLLEIDPLNLDYKQILGTLFLEHGQERQGMVLLSEVWQEREDVEVGHLLYRAYKQQGLKEKALPVLEALYRQSPDDIRLHEELFTLYLELGDDVKAQNFAPPVTENSPASLKRFIAAAQLHQRLGLEHIAADYWQAVLRKQPDFKLAHENLARYYTQNSRASEALPHKLFLYSRTEDNGRIAGEIGDYYVKANECSQAVFFLERSLASEPDQVERVRGLAYCYRQLGVIVDSAHYFELYLRLQNEPAPADRLSAALVFVEAGMKAEAAEQYRELLVQNPGDLDLLVALAQVETSRARFAQALTVWKQVAKRKPDDLASRLEILSLSEKLGKEDIHTVLTEIHALDKNNHRVSLLLALAAFENGDTAQGWNLFQPLGVCELFSADLLALRGEIYLFLNQPEHGFTDLAEAYRKDVNLPADKVLSYLEVAGVLGRLDIVYQLNQRYQFSQSADLHHVLLYADGLAECGDFPGALALYTQILGSDNRDLWPSAHHGLAEMYGRHGFAFAAEQEDRLNWLESKDSTALLRLVHNGLRQGENGEAEYWLDQYRVSGKGFDPLVYHAEMQLLAADGEPERALRLAADFRQSCRDAGVDCREAEMLIALEKTEILFQEDRLDTAHAAMGSLAETYPDEILPEVYGLKWAEYFELPAGIAPSAEQILQGASGEAGDLYTLQHDAQELGLLDFTTQINRKLYNEHPQSLKYGLALISSLVAKSSFDEALNIIAELQLVYPESFLLRLYGARVSLATGDFQKGLDFIGTTRSDFSLFEPELLRARFLWGLARWDDALRVYAENIKPYAEDEFLREIEALQLQLPPAAEPSLWVRVVKPLAVKRTPLERSFTLSGGTSADAYAVARLGTGFFARKRWQDFFAEELAARKSIRRREFFHAVNQYEAMGDALVEPTLLFDLAGVYASLKRVGDEAVIYEKIQDINPDFPGLAQAMNRNKLQRRPRTGVQLTYLSEEGWGGYKDMTVWQQNVHGWYSPRPRTELFLGATHLYHSAADSEETVQGNEVLAGFTSNVLDYFRIDMSGGVHMLADDYPDKGVFSVSLTGMANDFLKSHIGVERRVVKDTMASLNRGITAEEYTAQATVDLFPRLQVGGKLSRIHYSDDNEMNGYSLWGTLILQPQPNYLYLRGGYEFMDHQDGAGGTGAVLDDGFTEDDHPYWAPVNYWRNQYTLGYQYTYAETLFGHHLPGVVSALYLLEYDSDGELFHHLGAGLHMEITESWIFSFDGAVDFADDYDGCRVDGTLEYRW